MAVLWEFLILIAYLVEAAFSNIITLESKKGADISGDGFPAYELFVYTKNGPKPFLVRPSIYDLGVTLFPRTGCATTPSAPNCAERQLVQSHSDIITSPPVQVPNISVKNFPNLTSSPPKPESFFSSTSLSEDYDLWIPNMIGPFITLVQSGSSLDEKAVPAVTKIALGTRRNVSSGIIGISGRHAQPPSFLDFLEEFSSVSSSSWTYSERRMGKYILTICLVVS